jgi:hypothetical protein
MFILQELVSSFAIVGHLKKVAPERLVGAHLQSELEAVETELEKFLLFSLWNPFAQKGSALDKLCFYSEILLQASKVSEEKILAVLEEMRSSVLKVRSNLLSWKKGPSPYKEILVQLSSLFHDLQSHLVGFFRHLTPFLQEARTDENVLLYLIENRDLLNQYLGSRMIEDLLHRLFPSGLSGLRTAICEGYTRRGFASYYANKEPLIDAIEWEASCQPRSNPL